MGPIRRPLHRHCRHRRTRRARPIRRRGLGGRIAHQGTARHQGVLGVHAPRRWLLHDHIVEPGGDPGRLEGHLRAGARWVTVLETDITLDPPGAGDVAFGHVHLDLVAGAGRPRSPAGPGSSPGSPPALPSRPSRGVRGWHWDGTYASATTTSTSTRPAARRPTRSGTSARSTTPASGSSRPAPRSTTPPRRTRASCGPSSRSRRQHDRALRLEQRRQRGLHVQGRHGSLDGFHLRVVVTANADASVWYWNGRYNLAHDRGDDD